MGASQFAPQRLALLDRENGRVMLRLMRNTKPVEEGKQVFRRGGHDEIQNTGLKPGF